jgi:hypothetical protein
MKHHTENKKFGIWLLALMFLIPVVGLGQAQPLNELIEKARAAGIEEARIVELQNRAANRGITEEQLSVLLEPAVELAEQNLPSELIFQKAMEGIAKGVPAQQMIPVLQNIRQGTESVAPVVNSWIEREDVGRMIEQSGERFNRESMKEEMLSVSAKAVSQQVGIELVQDLLNMLTEQGGIPTTRPSSVLAAISIMPDIPSIHERPDAAKGVLVRAVQGGFTANDMQRLPGAMNMAQRRSQLPAAAVLEGVTQQLQGGNPAAEILQNLFNGNVGGGPPGNIPRGLENRPGRGQGGPGQGNNSGN